MLAAKFASLPQYANEFDVKKYGAMGDAKCVTDGVLTNASTTVTSATGGFSPADVGKTIWGTIAAGTLSLPMTTIASYVDPNTITIADAAGGNQTSVRLVWGTDDTTAIQAAAAAADAADPKGCVVVPRGGYIFSEPLFVQSYASGTKSYGVRGDGQASTVFYPTPDHTLTSGYVFSNVTNVDGGLFSGFTINGNFVTYSAGGGLIGMRLGSNVTVEDVHITAIRNTANISLFSCPGNNTTLLRCRVDYSSAYGISASGTLLSCIDCYAGNCDSFALEMYAAIVQWTGGEIDECSNNTVYMQASSRLDLLNALVYGGAGRTTMKVDGGTLRAVQSTIRPFWIDGANNASGLDVSSGSFAHLSQCTLTGSGTGKGLINAGTVYDGGNNFSSATTNTGTISVPTL